MNLFLNIIFVNIIIYKHNNTCHSTIKIKHVDVKSNKYNNSGKNINDKDSKFKIGDIVRILKYKNIFAKDYVLKKVKDTIRWTCYWRFQWRGNFWNVLQKGIAKNKSKGF